MIVLRLMIMVMEVRDDAKNDQRRPRCPWRALLSGLLRHSLCLFSCLLLRNLLFRSLCASVFIYLLINLIKYKLKTKSKQKDICIIYRYAFERQWIWNVNVVRGLEFSEVEKA